MIINDYKKDVNNFINNICDENNLDSTDVELIRFISKKIIFIKIVKHYSTIKNNKKLLMIIISDFMYLIDSYVKNELRYVNLNLRSLIENLTRLFLQENNQLNMKESFEKLQAYSKPIDNSLSRKIDSVQSIYKDACNYIHSNPNIDLKLVEFYNDIVNLQINSNEKLHIRMEISTLVNTFLKLSIIKFANEIDSMFIRQKDELSYLIGKGNLELLKKNK